MPDARGRVAVLQVGDIGHDDRPNGRRNCLAQVRDERLSGGLAKNPEQRHQDKQAREDGLDAEIRQCSRAVLQVVSLIFLEGPFRGIQKEPPLRSVGSSGT